MFSVENILIKYLSKLMFTYSLLSYKDYCGLFVKLIEVAS